MRSLFTLVPVLILAISAPAQAHVPTTLPHGDFSHPEFPHSDFRHDLPTCTPPGDASTPDPVAAAVPEPSAISLGIVAAALFACLWQRQRCAIQERPQPEKPSQRWTRASRRQA